MPAPKTETAAGTDTPDRFDPFLLPTATGIRFSLLILAAFVISMYLGFWYAAMWALLGGDQGGTALFTTCAVEARQDANWFPDRAVFDGFITCYRAAEWRNVLEMTVLGPVWVGLTAALYAAYPLLLNRRLRPARIPEDSGVWAARQETGTAPDGTHGRVNLLTTRGTAGGARVFGAFGRYRLAIDTSLLVAREDDGGLDERSLAVIRHEMAHVHNRDVGITYLTMSSWWAFALIASVPLIANSLRILTVGLMGAPIGPLHEALVPLVFITLVILLLHAARARVLRTREHYADVRAACNGGTENGLRRILSHPVPSPRGLRRWWRGYHPSHQSRLSALDDPRRLAAISHVDLAITGIVLGAAQGHLGVVGGVVAGGAGVVTAAVLVGLPVGALVAAIVWNAVHAAPAGTHRWSKAATVLAAGVLLGLSLPIQLVTTWTDVLMESPVLALVSGLVLWGFCLVFLKWAALCARIWLAVVKRKRAVCAAGLVCGGVVFGCLFGLWNTLYGMLDLLDAGGLAGVGYSLVTAMIDWPFAAAVGCASVFLFAGLIRGSNVRGPARRPLLPIVAGCAVAMGNAVLTLAFGTGTGTLFAILIDTIVGFGLGVWSGGRGRLGAALCTAAVFVLVLLALEPLVYHANQCLVVDTSPHCWGSTGGVWLDTYSTYITFVLPAILGACCTGAAIGSGVRAAAQKQMRSTRTRSTFGVPQMSQTLSVLAAVAVTAIVLGAGVFSSGPEYCCQTVERQTHLRSQVEPGTVSPEAACASVMASLDVAAGGPGPRPFSDNSESGIVALASSRDPALAAFGRAGLDGSSDTGVYEGLHAALNYCRALTGP